MTAPRTDWLRRALLAALAVAALVAVARTLPSGCGGVPGAPGGWADAPGDGPAEDRTGPAVPAALQSARYTTVLDLAGPWQIRLGDEPAWAAPVVPGADTSAWQSVPVPGAWEDAGLWGYDGFAWLRRTFRLPPGAGDDGRPLVLRIGRVDDVDEVYLNGQRVGATGTMPPDYETAYFHMRAYFLPADALRPGLNTLAVRVYDGELSGGLVAGPVEIACAAPGTPSGTPLVVDLAGRWRAAPGDDPARAAVGFDDRAWAELTVPERWESQGYPDADGFAWFRRSVALSAADAARPLTFVAEAIDDLDEVFVNGVRIGGMGLPGRLENGRPVVEGSEWQTPRAYAVPPGVLRAGRNTVAVRIFDGLYDGGIVQGPVGFAAPDAARTFAQSLRGDSTFAQGLGGDIR